MGGREMSESFIFSLLELTNIRNVENAIYDKLSKMNTATHHQQSDYAGFLRQKSQLGKGAGFSPVWMPDFLFDFQTSLVEWALDRGRAAIFADCGLGKTPMQLVWAENVRRKTNRPVLIITPLAVSGQTVDESEKFGIEAKVSRDGSVQPGITITNYERLHNSRACLPEGFEFETGYGSRCAGSQ
jgi:hypothetical protein